MSYEYLGKVGGFIILSAHLPLYMGILRKTIKPSVATWGMWSVMLSATLISQVLAGKEDPWGMLAATVGTVVAFVLLWFYGEKVWTEFETKCLKLSGAGIVIWMVSGPELAQIAFLASLMIAGAPTIKNVWLNPENESSLVWGVFTVGFFITMIAVQDWTSYSNWIQPVTSTIFNALIFILALRQHKG